MRTRNRILAAAGAAALVLGVGGVAAATQVMDDDATDQPITGDALERASDAALEHTGEGKVTETEVGDEESYYEVEVTRPGGSQVDVQLDRDFNVVTAKTDSERDD